MAESPLKDPAALWRDWVAQWEKGLNTFANQTMGSDEFSKYLNQMTSLMLRMQQSMGDLLGRYLKFLNLPSRDDLARLEERLQGIDASLNRISMMLERAAASREAPGASAAPASSGPTPLVPRPPRTKQPPSQASQRTEGATSPNSETKPQATQVGSQANQGSQG
ncbi:MAG: hypothetical protein JOY71_03345 [Acetobacteraceae bacterium]|nr:hypothetical protein [Acetobacteraceae bacterium]MBV8521161.1 hypothetical protein [Acetobacteraceae bacterium]MBV8588800.1 hypothetical protein [Acetobacteraceae bacterium]